MKIQLDFSKSSLSDRLEVANRYAHSNLTAKNCKHIADYLLWSRDDNGVCISKNEDFELSSKWSASQPDSMEAIMEQEGTPPNFHTVGEIPPTLVRKQKFSRAEALASPLAPHFKALFEEIDRLDVLISFAMGKEPREELVNRIEPSCLFALRAKAAKLSPKELQRARHDLVDLRTEQYELRDSYKPQLRNAKQPLGKMELAPLEIEPLGMWVEPTTTLGKFLWAEEPTPPTNEETRRKLAQALKRLLARSCKHTTTQTQVEDGLQAGLHERAVENLSHATARTCEQTSKQDTIGQENSSKTDERAVKIGSNATARSSRQDTKQNKIEEHSCQNEVGLQQRAVEKTSHNSDCLQQREVKKSCQIHERAVTFDLRDPNSWLQLLPYYNTIYNAKLEAEERHDIESEAPALWNTIQYYFDRALMQAEYRLIVEMKSENWRNEDINNELRRRNLKTFSVNYISTIYKKRIPKLLAQAVEAHYELALALDQPDEWKRCSKCGKLLHLDSNHFRRLGKSKDGFVGSCKQCDKKKR
nr:MAG TPA: RNA polymerase subunit [Caudoviricetes sp.]